MLEKTSLTWLPADRRISNRAEDQDWVRARAQHYCEVDSLLVPPIAVSVFESALYKLYGAGIYTDPLQIPRLSEGHWDGPWVSGVRMLSDLIIEDGEGGSAYMTVTIEHRNQIDEVDYRERIETVERGPFAPFQIYLPQAIYTNQDGTTVNFSPVMVARGAAEISSKLHSDQIHFGIPGNHSGPRFLTTEQEAGLRFSFQFIENDAGLTELEVKPFKGIYADQYGRYQTHVPDSRLRSPSIVLPTEKSWTAAVAIVAGTGSENDFADMDEWLESIDLDGYSDFNEDSEQLGIVPESRLLDLLRDPEFPLIVIADPSPFSRYHWHEDPYQEIKDALRDCAQIVRITWPMQPYLQAESDEGSFMPPGSVRICFPNAYRKLGIANILVTADEIATAEKLDGALYDDELRSMYWRKKFEEALTTAFMPCTELHPEYLNLRQESSRLDGLRRQSDLEKLDDETKRIQEIRDQMINRWDNVDAAERKFKALEPKLKTLDQKYNALEALHSNVLKELDAEKRDRGEVFDAWARAEEDLRLTKEELGSKKEELYRVNLKLSALVSRNSNSKFGNVPAETTPSSDVASWTELEEYVRRSNQNLTFSANAFEPLRGQPFVQSASRRIMTLLNTLDSLKGCFIEDGKRSLEGHQLIDNHFKGTSAWFSDSSDTEAREFEDQLTFPTPGNPREKLLYRWHGKVRSPELRIHHSWPVKYDSPVYVVYVGPKITKK